MSLDFTQDDLNIRVAVSTGFIVTLGVYGGPITKRVVAQAVKDHVERLSVTEIAELIDRTELDGMSLDDGTDLLEL